MPATMDEEDKSRNAKQRRFEEIVKASAHVDDEAFMDEWKTLRTARQAVTLKINHINNEKRPLLLKTRELQKQKNAATRDDSVCQKQMIHAGVMKVFLKLVKGRSSETLQLYANALTSRIKLEATTRDYEDTSERTNQLDILLAEKSKEKTQFSFDLDQVFDMYQTRIDKRAAGASNLPVVADLSQLSGDTLNLSDDEEASQASLSANDNLRMRLENMVMKSLRDNVFDLSEKMEVEEFMDRKSIPRSTFFEILVENGWTKKDYYNGRKDEEDARPAKRQATAEAGAAPDDDGGSGVLDGPDHIPL